MTSRFLLSILTGAAIVAAAIPAYAGSSLLGAGSANWFYACANSEPMNTVIGHRDGTTTQFSLLPGQTLRTQVRQGDGVAWRCGAAVTPADRFIYIVTVPSSGG